MPKHSPNSKNSEKRRMILTCRLICLFVFKLIITESAILRDRAGVARPKLSNIAEMAKNKGKVL